MPESEDRRRPSTSDRSAPLFRADGPFAVGEPAIQHVIDLARGAKRILEFGSGRSTVRPGLDLRSHLLAAAVADSTVVTFKRRRCRMPARRALARTVVDWNVAAARFLDRRVLGNGWCVSAVGDFSDAIAPSLLRPGMHVWDIGCGSQPLVAPEVKRRLGLTITGLDADAGELALMPPGLCDRTITADLCDFRGDESADLVICRCVLEHVPNTEMAFSALATVLRPGGMLVICVPCRNAPSLASI